MKRNTKIILVAVTAITLVSGTFAVAGGGHGRMGERMISKLTDRLELDEQQVAALDSLHLELKETRELMRGDSDAQGQGIKELINADSFDQGAAMEMITARTTAIQTQGPDLVAAAGQFFDGLNDQQKLELNELMDRFSNHRGDRSQKGN